MTALSLRLGLWLAHPLSGGCESTRFPGRFLLREAFSRTRCEPITRAQAEALAAPGIDVGHLSSDVVCALRTRSVHLSDGGHFENLGLYELVRRHCRYVIVSDATADPTTSFDDLANAVRRVREDFGVEIELDVSPLRRGDDGLSNQHAVVGTIHYDGSGGIDKGVLLYFKPSLLGEEPTDIMQYRRRNPAFPHEGTVDQFYDEAQWESYRRLGEHAVHAVMAFMDRGWRPQANFVERMFDEATKRWHPAQANHDEVFLELTSRCAALDSAVRDGAPLRLRSELFPEIAATFGEPAGVRATLEDEIKTVYYLMYAIQVMEDVWVGAELERYWSHPLNEGWMNYFQRWTNTPSFRRWWAILRPIYSLHFRDFVRDRFSVRIKDPLLNGDGSSERAAELKLRARAPADLSGLAVAMWKQKGGALPPGSEALEYCLELPGENGALPAIQVGFLVYSRIDSTTVQWKRSAMFVSPALVGSGIVSRFLDAVIAHINAEGAQRALVVLDDDPGTPPSEASTAPRRRDAASRRECLNHLNFYKSRGFIDRDQTTSAGMRVIELDLAAPRAARPAEAMPTDGASLVGAA